MLRVATLVFAALCTVPWKVRLRPSIEPATLRTEPATAFAPAKQAADTVAVFTIPHSWL
jgi:hypothetical protein